MYYYNANTGETSWDKPTVDEVAADEEAEAKEQIDVDDVFATMNAEFGVTDESERPPSPFQQEDQDGTDHGPEGSDSPEYQWPTGDSESSESSSEDDSSDSDDQASDEPEDAPEHSEAVSATETYPPSPAIAAEGNSFPLPVDWSELEDATSGQKYYYNVATGETSWTGCQRVQN